MVSCWAAILAAAQHLRHRGIHIDQTSLCQLPQRHSSEELGVGACRAGGTGCLACCAHSKCSACLGPAHRFPPPRKPPSPGRLVPLFSFIFTYRWALPRLEPWQPPAQGRSIRTPAGVGRDMQGSPQGLKRCYMQTSRQRYPPGCWARLRNLTNSCLLQGRVPPEAAQHAAGIDEPPAVRPSTLQAGLPARKRSRSPCSAPQMWRLADHGPPGPAAAAPSLLPLPDSRRARRWPAVVAARGRAKGGNAENVRRRDSQDAT